MTSGLMAFTLLHVVLSLIGFPFTTFLPSHAVAIVSLAVLVVVVLARYFKDLAGGWRRTYVTGAVLALYLNVFVLLAQLFLRLPALMQAAPSQKESPFVITQLVTLALFAGLGWAAIRG